MRKQEFLDELQMKLSGLPRKDIEERIAFYSEILDDRIEEGYAEEDAVREIGSVDEIATQIIADTPFSKIAKERIRPKRRLSMGEIMLLTLGSPIWLSLLIAAFAVMLSLYVSLWSVVISLWAVFASLAVCLIGGVSACVVFIVGGNAASGVAMLATGIVCAGLSIFMFYGCKAVTSGILMLTKKMAIWLKNCFIKKEVAK